MPPDFTNVKLSNVIGAPFADYVLQQLAIRANRNTTISRNTEEVLFLANKSAWARLVSSVNINGNQDQINKFYGNLRLQGIPNLDPDGLARNWILEAGTSVQEGNGILLRSGIGLDDNAYGLGGTGELGYRPMPGLTSVQVETLGKLGSLRQATISFKVWNINQLNVIEALYFRLGYSMLLEWGHTQYFSNVDSKTGKFTPQGTFVAKDIYGIGDPFAGNKRKLEIQQEIAKKSRDTYGNYDGMLGIVSNFNWAFNQEGGYDCTVRIIGPGAIMNTTRVNQAYQLPDGEIKRFLRNKEILNRRILELEKRQEELDKKLTTAGGAPAGTTTSPPPPAPTNLAELKNYLVTYDGANPAIDPATDAAYKVVGYDWTYNGTTWNYVPINQIYARFVTAGRKPNPDVGGDKRLQVDNAYKGLYPTANNSPFGNISKASGIVNTTNAVINPGAFDRFGKAVSTFNNVFPNVVQQPANYATRVQRELNSNGITVTNGGVLQIAQQLLYDIEEREVNSNTGQTEPFPVEMLPKARVKFSVNEQREIGFGVNIAGTQLYFKGILTVESNSPGSEVEFPLTRKIAIETFQNRMSTGKGAIANISELTRNNEKVLIKGQIIFDNVAAPYVGTATTLIGQTRSYKLVFQYETNNLILFQPDTPAAQPPKKGTGTDAGGGTGTKNTTTDSQQRRSDGFQSALHAMLTIVQAQVQARAPNTPVACLSINDSDPTRASEYRAIIDGFFSKGILNGVLDPAAVTTNPDLKYALKGFNANLMLNPNLYDSIPDVDFANLTKAFIVRIDQNREDGLKDNVRCPVYISFGFLLAFLSNMCIVYDATRPLRDIASGAANNDRRPYFYIDFNPSTNLCLTFPQQFSVDPFVCLIPFSATLPEYQSIFPPEVSSTILKFNPEKNNVLRQALEKQDYNFQGKVATQGQIMKILLNVDYLLNLLSEFQYSDPEHAVNLQPFVERILIDIGKCTGNANYFKLVYRDDANTVQIIDYQVAPNYLGEKTMTQQDAYNRERRSTNLESRILSGELPIFGSGSIAREFQLKTTISTNLAKMIAISASPVTQSVNATEHSSFSTLNELYIDRYKQYPQDSGAPQPSQNTNTKGSKNVSNDLAAAELFDQHTSAVNSNFQVSKDDIEQAKNYYIERISKVKAGLPEAVATNPIPANAEITIDGISGIVMYNAFAIPEERLPISLRGLNGDARFGFIVSGLTHTIENNQWLTKLTGQMFPLRKAGSVGRSILFTSADQTAIPGSTGGNAPLKGTTSRVPRNTDLFRNKNSPATSDYLLGTPRSISDTPAHANWGGLKDIWQNANAWDLGAAAGTPVYAIVDGSISNVYFAENSDTVWGWAFTLKGATSSFFYCHLDHVVVAGGTTVKRGDLVGYIGQWPDDYTRLRNYPHLHIGVQVGKLRNYVDATGRFI